MTRRTAKTLIVILGISLLALSSAVAWPFSQKGESKAIVPLVQTLPSVQEMPSSQEEKTEQPKPSEDLATTSKEEVVCIPKDDLVDIVSELEVGVTEMSDGHEVVSTAAVDYERKYAELMKPKFYVKAIADWDFDKTFGVGIGGGMLIAQKYMFDLSIVKKDITCVTDYANINAYRATFSIGYVF